VADGSIALAARVGPAPPRRRPRGLLWRLRQPEVTAFLLCLPLLALVVGLMVFPAFYAIYLSMLSKSMERFVGLDNFAFLFKRETFWNVAWQSTVFAVTAVILKALIGFVLAHLIHTIPAKGQRIWRGLLLVPWVMPLSIGTLAWWWLLDPSYSAFNWVIEAAGGSRVPWLGDTFWARVSVILVNVWYGAPFFMIMYLAALKSVPEQLYEAAAIDGASGLQKLWHVTLPMMQNIIAITVLFSLIVTFANFDIVRILTNGGPRDTTHIFATYSFQLGIGSGDIPLGAAVSLFMFPILALFAVFILRGVQRRAEAVG